MKLLSVSLTTEAPVLNPQEGKMQSPAPKIHNHSSDEIYLRPIAVIKPAFLNGMPGTDISEKGSLVDVYA